MKASDLQSGETVPRQYTTYQQNVAGFIVRHIRLVERIGSGINQLEQFRVVQGCYVDTSVVGRFEMYDFISRSTDGSCFCQVFQYFPVFHF
mgnify:CR=1 FL=1